MKEDIKVPAMGESVTEATVGSFLKPSGAAVAENDEIIELETEKVNQVLYAPTAGVISWSVSEGDAVQIGQLLGHVDSEATPTVTAPTKKKEAPPPKEKKPTAPTGPSARLKEDAFVASLKEKRAPQREERVKPTRPGESRRKMTKIRKTIAARLVESLHSAAMLTTFNEVDMSAVIALRTRHKESFQKKHGVKLGFMSFFVKAATLALQEFPNFNCYLDGDDIIQREYYNIGIAVGGAERGLVVPVVNDCDTLSLAQIEQTIADLAARARDGKLQIEDLQGGGFTITNGGVYGSLLSTPLLNPPQVGILGMHNIVKRPIAVDDQVVIRPMMYLAVSYDHRLIDGREAILFLMRIKEVLEDPKMDGV